MARTRDRLALGEPVSAVEGRETYAWCEGTKLSIYTRSRLPWRIEVSPVVSWIEGVDSEEHEELSDKFFELFETTTESLKSALGPPAFSDGAAASSFPTREDAIWLSLWELADARFMVQVRHEGMDVPMRMTLVVEMPKGDPRQ